ncbi:MAG: hypothetical protein ACRDL7_12010, partial [Gaiellaceae bacterium]
VSHRMHDSIDYFDSIAKTICEVQAAWGLVLLSGDLNSRTAALPDFDDEECSVHMQVPELVPGQKHADFQQRCNMDTVVNRFGQSLLQLCKDSGLLILNGRVNGDTTGKFTCCVNTANGPTYSTVDYFIASPELLNDVQALSIDQSIPACVSDQFLVVLQLRTDRSWQEQTSETPPALHPRTSYKYKKNNSDAFCDILQDLLSTHLTTDLDTHQLAAAIQGCITDAAAAAHGRREVSVHSCSFPRNSWYDDECKALRKHIKTTYRMGNHDLGRELQKRYKHLTRKKKALYNAEMSQKLCDFVDADPRRFWQQYKGSKPMEQAVSAHHFHEAFQHLYSSPDDGDMQHGGNSCTTTTWAPSHCSHNDGAQQGISTLPPH